MKIVRNFSEWNLILPLRLLLIQQQQRVGWWRSRRRQKAMAANLNGNFSSLRMKGKEWKFDYQEISVWGVGGMWRRWWRHCWIQQREKSDQRFRQVDIECFELARYEHSERGRKFNLPDKANDNEKHWRHRVWLNTQQQKTTHELISRCFLQILVSIRRQLPC